MYQCAPGTPAVSPGWSVFGVNTNTSSVLWNTCSTGGAIGDSVASNEEAGAVTENGHSGSQVGLQIDVPPSAPDVTIQSITAEVIGSSVTGDDAWLGFTSGGQALPGAVELPYGGGSNYTASESWTLPQGARDFEANVTCSTDDSSPTCYFADSIAVPALNDITLTLIDNTPPAVSSVSGALASAAAAKSTVAGSQLLNFTGVDADSGVRSATLTLSPQAGGAPYTHTFDFSSQCSYDAWNACPLTQTVSGFAVNTSSLKDDSYAASLAVTDAAGNVASDPLGTIVSDNAPANTSAPTILVPGQVLVGSALTTQPGAWSAPSGAGVITYGYQWEQCDSQGNNCQQIAGAQNATYTPAPSDVGHTLRLLVTATDSDGSTVTASTPTSLVLAAAGSLGALPGPGTSGEHRWRYKHTALASRTWRTERERRERDRTNPPGSSTGDLPLVHPPLTRAQRTATRRSGTADRQRHPGHPSADRRQQQLTGHHAREDTVERDLRGAYTSRTIAADRGGLPRVRRRRQLRRAGNRR